MDKTGEYQGFPPENFCLTVRKISVGESFAVAVFSGTGKVLIRSGGGGGGGGVSRFSVDFFCLAVPKKFAGEPFFALFRNIPVAKKILDKSGGVSRFSVENFLSRSAEKSRRCTLLCCVSENFQ